MSYPRNAGTPPRISIGPVVQISDGAVQTSGVSITVVPQGQSAAAGLGTTSYENGVVLYAPTQAETNYDAFVVIAYKTGCIPASVNVVTSRSSTAGYAGVDWAHVTGATSTVNLSGTTVKTATDVETDTQDIQSRIPTALVSGRIDSSVGAYQSGMTPLQPTVAGRTLDVSSGGEAGIDWANIGSPTTTVAFTGTTISTSQVVASVTNRVTANTDQWGGVAVTGMPMPTYTQPTGFLAATFPTSVASPTNITAGTITTVSGNVSGNVVGSVGSVVAAVTAGTVSDKTGYSLTNLTVQSSTILATGTHTAQTGDSFARIGSTGSGLTSLAPASTALSTAVWTGTMAGYLDAAVSSRSSHSAADVWSVTTRTLSAFSFSVTVGTNNDKTGYSLATAPLDASGTAAAVWGALLASYTTANTFGARVVRSTNSNNTVQITGSQHVAADIHELQAGVITAGDFAAGAIDANALAADAADEVAAAVWSYATRELTAFSFAIAVDSGAIADAVLDELLAGHTIPGSVGAALSAASASGDPWATVLPGAYASGTAGAIIGAVLAAIDAVPTTDEIDAVLTASHGSGSWVGAGSTSSGGDTSGLSSEILAAAGGPAEVQNGDQKVKARSIAELIEADKHLAAKAAAADPGSIFRRITPPGAR